MTDHTPHKPHHRPDENDEPVPARKPIDPDQGAAIPPIPQDPEQDGGVEPEV